MSDYTTAAQTIKDGGFVAIIAETYSEALQHAAATEREAHMNTATATIDSRGIHFPNGGILAPTGAENRRALEGARPQHIISTTTLEARCRVDELTLIRAEEDRPTITWIVAP